MRKNVKKTNKDIYLKFLIFRYTAQITALPKHILFGVKLLLIQ